MAKSVSVFVSFSAPSVDVECNLHDLVYCQSKEEVGERVARWGMSRMTAKALPDPAAIRNLWAAVQKLREREV